MEAVSRFVRKVQPELALLPERLRGLNDFPGLWKAAAQTDETPIRQFVASCRAEYDIKWLTPENADLIDIENSYLRNGGVLAVLERDSAILATLGLNRLSADTCQLAKFYLSPILRDRRLGAKVLDTAIHLAKESGFQRILLETSPQFELARRLYQSRGFRTAATELTKIHLEDGVHLELILEGAHV